MKIRIKKKLNEGKGADIITHGLNANFLSDTTKRVLDKKGGLTALLSGDKEILFQVIELAIGLGFNNKENLIKDAKIFRSMTSSNDAKIEKAKEEIKKAHEQANQAEKKYLDYEMKQSGMSYDDLMYGPAGGGPFYGIILQKNREKIDAAENKLKKIEDENQLFITISEKFSNAAQE